ncbi:lycopene cyclase domain-containing protein [Actinopolymorpha sp. B17G11]|uniref:lycopene cyclase domain-containing protein n=1 Tax=Actinopolymorpha sp. B17G11 TaxID=3160861 RepID=UPI0032E3AADD
MLRGGASVGVDEGGGGPIDRYQYLLLMAACLAVTLPLEWVLGARVYRRPRRLALVLGVVVVVFLVWDAVAIARGHWQFSPRYTTGALMPFGIPVEELVFFVVVPLCALLTYEAVGTLLRHSRRSGRPGRGPHA